MDYTFVKNAVRTCPQLQRQDDTLLARLLWIGVELEFPPKAAIYTQHHALDNTFYLLLAGRLDVFADGKPVGQIVGNHIFGEVAYFTANKQRSTSVLAGQGGATLLRFDVAEADLKRKNGPFAKLAKVLGVKAWSIFVFNANQG